MSWLSDAASRSKPPLSNPRLYEGIFFYLFSFVVRCLTRGPVEQVIT